MMTFKYGGVHEQATVLYETLRDFTDDMPKWIAKGWGFSVRSANGGFGQYNEPGEPIEVSYMRSRDVKYRGEFDV